MLLKVISFETDIIENAPASVEDKFRVSDKTK